MPVLETDFLKGLIDPTDALHPFAARALRRVKEGVFFIAPLAFLELDLLLKSHGFLSPQRSAIFRMLQGEVPAESILPSPPELLSVAIDLQQKYPFGGIYFDSFHIAAAILYDGHIVSSDAAFSKVREVRATDIRDV